MGRTVKKKVKFMSTHPSGVKSKLDTGVFEADENIIDDLIVDRVNEFETRLNKEVVYEVLKVDIVKTVEDFFDERDQIDKGLEEDVKQIKDAPATEKKEFLDDVIESKTTDDYNVQELREFKKNGEPLPELHEDEDRTSVYKIYNINKE